MPTEENPPRATLLERMGGAKDTETRPKTPPLGRPQTPIQEQNVNETSVDVRGNAGRRMGRRRHGQGLR